MIIGLTGLYCAGKNHVGLLLEKRGLSVLDIDKLGHKVIACETEKIVRRFGKAVLKDDGQIDRQLLRKQVFGNPEAIAELEALIHPGVNKLTEEWVDAGKAEQNGLFVVNAALLHKSSLFSKFGAVIVVSAPLMVRFSRALKRDRLSLRQFLRIVSAQKQFPCYKNEYGSTQLSSCTADIYTIQNSGFFGSRQTLEKRIDTILERLRYGKEKIIDGCGVGGSVSCNCGECSHTDL